jgi:hypothetical protein
VSAKYRVFLNFINGIRLFVAVSKRTAAGPPITVTKAIYRRVLAPRYLAFEPFYGRRDTGAKFNAMIAWLLGLDPSSQMGCFCYF